MTTRAAADTKSTTRDRTHNISTCISALSPAVFLPSERMLPTDTCRHVLVFLDLRDGQRASGVCRTFRDAERECGHRSLTLRFTRERKSGHSDTQTTFESKLGNYGSTLEEIVIEDTGVAIKSPTLPLELARLVPKLKTLRVPASFFPRGLADTILSSCVHLKSLAVTSAQNFSLTVGKTWTRPFVAEPYCLPA